MKKIFISQGMNGKDDKSIERERNYLKNVAESCLCTKCTVIDSIIKDTPPEKVNEPLWYLAKSLELMSGAETVIFAKDWADYRGCRIEHEAALAYGLRIIESYSEEKGEI